jgi:hypothetical protein
VVVFVITLVAFHLELIFKVVPVWVEVNVEYVLTDAAMVSIHTKEVVNKKSIGKM